MDFAEAMGLGCPELLLLLICPWVISLERIFTMQVLSAAFLPITAIALATARHGAAVVTAEMGGQKEFARPSTKHCSHDLCLKVANGGGASVAAAIAL